MSLRFWNIKIFEELDPVLEAIDIALTTPHPNPPPQGGRGTRGRPLQQDAVP